MKEYNLKINGNDYKVGVEGVNGGVAKVVVNGTSYSVEVGESKAAAPVQVAAPKAQAPVSTPVAAPAKAAPSGSALGGELKSPLPGVIVGVMVKAGDKVEAGQRVMVLEAMKMENNIEANKSGVVKTVAKNQGDSVMEGDLLLVIE